MPSLGKRGYEPRAALRRMRLLLASRPGRPTSNEALLLWRLHSGQSHSIISCMHTLMHTHCAVALAVEELTETQAICKSRKTSAICFGIGCVGRRTPSRPQPRYLARHGPRKNENSGRERGCSNNRCRNDQPLQMTTYMTAVLLGLRPACYGDFFLGDSTSYPG